MSSTTGRRRYLHVGVSDALRARITNRELAPGAILPSENDLTEEFGVSRSVVRQALRTLADEGHVQPVPGRGTVVTSHREWHRDAQRTAGLSAQMRALGARVSTRVLTYAVRPASEAGHGFEGRALLLERLRLLDDEPVAYIRTWLPGWVADKVSREDLEDASLHGRLLERAGVSVQGGRRQIRAVAAAGDLARRLAVAEGAPVLLLEGESTDQHGTVIEAFSTWHRSDRIALDIADHQAGRGQDEAAPGLDPAAVSLAEQAALETVRQIRALRARA